MKQISKIIFEDTKLLASKSTNSLLFSGSVGSIKKQFGGFDVLINNSQCYFLSKCSFKTFMSIIKKSLEGISVGYYCEITFLGLGYRFIQINDYLLLKVGYGHYIKIYCPKSLLIFGYKKRLVIFGMDIVILNNFVATLRNYRYPDIYKGKGIRLLGEELKFKVGKQKL